jgi:hypothetical protein
LKSTQAPEQEENPTLHAIPQALPLHVARPFFGTAQRAQRVPQVSMESFGTQIPPQTWLPA